MDWQHRAQFFAISAQIMHNILVDAARARGAHKRGGEVVKINLDDAPLLSPEPAAFILALDEALAAFSEVAPRQAKVVELRYFGGMSEERDGGGFEDLSANGQAGLAVRQSLAAA